MGATGSRVQGDVINLKGNWRRGIGPQHLRGGQRSAVAHLSLVTVF